VTSSGNRCGHDRRNPRLELEHPETRGKPFPWLIRTALERLEGLYRHRELFPELGARKRSERIEAMVLVAKAVVRNTDRLTLRSGHPQADGTVRGITVVTMAKWARLHVARRRSGRLTSQRACRALWDLRDAGYIDCTQPIEKRADGSRRGLAGVRIVRRRLFERLGLGPRLTRERRELQEKARGERRAETIAERRRLRRLFRESRRAGVLARRATHQLADAAAPAAPRTFTHAELAEQLAAWRARQTPET
jgi:hypothetical protein